MERKTFSIMFFIKRTKLKKNQEAPVILRITVNRERADISIQRSINPELWKEIHGKLVANIVEIKANISK